MKNPEKIRALIRLALVDNNFQSEERELIRELSDAEGLSEDEYESIVQSELENKESQGAFSFELDYNGKIDMLAALIRTMKADGKVYLSEIRFCEMMAKVLGFKHEAVGFLSEYIHQDDSVAPDWSMLHERMRKYQI